MDDYKKREGKKDKPYIPDYPNTTTDGNKSDSESDPNYAYYPSVAYPQKKDADKDEQQEGGADPEKRNPESL